MQRTHPDVLAAEIMNGCRAKGTVSLQEFTDYLSKFFRVDESSLSKKLTLELEDGVTYAVDEEGSVKAMFGPRSLSAIKELM